MKKLKLSDLKLIKLNTKESNNFCGGIITGIPPRLSNPKRNDPKDPPLDVPSSDPGEYIIDGNIWWEY